MKVKGYVRVGRGPNGKTKLAVTSRPSNEPLKTGTPGYNEKALPTVRFAVEFEIPDDAFKEAETILATILAPKRDLKVAAEVKKT